MKRIDRRKDTVPPPGAAKEFENWIFDLDNTLYPASSGLMDQIRERITAFIRAHLSLDHQSALSLQERYYRTYKTSMRGLMLHHDVEPDSFMHFVHDIDLSRIKPDKALRSALSALPGRRLIFTNASSRHADTILNHLGLADLFDEIFDIKAADYLPKPFSLSYGRLIKSLNLKPQESVFLEDMPVNLEPAAAIGMTTVWVREDQALAPDENLPPYIHHLVPDLPEWLRAQANTTGANLGFAS